MYWSSCCKHYRTPKRCGSNPDQCRHPKSKYGMCAAGICPEGYGRDYIEWFRMGFVIDYDDMHSVKNDDGKGIL